MNDLHDAWNLNGVIHIISSTYSEFLALYTPNI